VGFVSPSRGAPIRGAAAVVLGLSLVGACRRADPPRGCPARFVEDAPRARAIVEGLRSTGEGAALLARVAALPPICFGPAAVSVITTEGVVLFDAGLTGAEAAARLGHLVAHAVEGVPMARPSAGDCEAQVAVALAQEARALSLELRLRRALGVSAAAPAGRHIPYAFEEAFWAAPTEVREGLVLAYLRAHPDGAPGLDALASGYARRCAEGR
jgi:hypothetical protein